MAGKIIRHLTQKAYWKYIFRSAAGWVDPRRFCCPNCGARNYTPVTRKLVVTRLVRCEACRVLYRVPNDPPRLALESLYQDDYDATVYSDLPSREELQALIEKKFSGSARDYRPYLHAIQALGISPGARLFELGASWGYGAWQFQDAGYAVGGFELGKTRARFAREKLGVRVEDDRSRLKTLEKFDCFFSAHVLEHIPAPLDVLRMAKQLLAPGGLFVAVTPNGSLRRFQKTPRAYQSDWGMYHPIFLDEEFYQKTFSGIPMLLAGYPSDLGALRAWDRKSTVVTALADGGELLLALEMGPSLGKLLTP
jgi:2-polyprenyl-3-methyl-5-hydroxy-6-metoxy-1,4-benzoquinol methylase